MTTNHTTTPPIDYGHRLIPTLVDEYARTDPDYVYALIPKTTDFKDGLKEITIGAFARAVDEVASRIDSRIGKCTTFDTIAYIGPSQSKLPWNVIAMKLTPSSGSQIFCYCTRCGKNGLQGQYTIDSLQVAPI